MTWFERVRWSRALNVLLLGVCVLLGCQAGGAKRGCLTWAELECIEEEGGRWQVVDYCLESGRPPMLILEWVAQGEPTSTPTAEWVIGGQR